MIRKKLHILLTAATCLSAGIAHAETTANPLPHYADGAPVVLSGTIDEVRRDEFDLNYGKGKVKVELGGWNWSGNETKYLNRGDRITVTGRIDDGLFTGREIQAENIYLPKSSTYYYMTDSHPSYYWFSERDKPVEDGSIVTMRGTVSKISGNEFMLTGVGNRSMQVDVSNLDNTPLDDEGGQKIRNGDRVQVYGAIDDDFFESREIMANNIVVLSQVGVRTQN